MTNGITDMSSLEDLRGFVQRTICDHKQLLLGAFKFHEKILVQNGKPCGLHFSLNGPRAVQFSAIWDAARHTILFYDCNGERFHRSDLVAVAGLREELAGLTQINEKLVA
jgi:hypothetical protein